MQLQTISEHNTCKGSAWATYLSEASTLGMVPGKWSVMIPCDPNFGNGQPFCLVRSMPGSTTYRQGNGCLDLIVFDD